MPEKTEREKKFKREIPEETRKHFRVARQEMRAAFEGFLPEGFMEHRRTARREMMLAVRSMLDAAIKRMDEKAQ